MLEAIASVYGKEGEVISALDAGRGEIYIAECEIKNGAVNVNTQQILPPREFLAVAAGRPVITPDAKIAELVRAPNLPATLVTYPRADVIASIGFKKIKAGDVVSVEALDANYIRRSDAEIKFPGR
jgi:tRNA threonylcarbamoyladenosine biosynthesis protein TsaB